MANTIKLKRASGSDPSASDLSVGELAIRTSNCKVFSKNDGGSAIGIVAGSADTLTNARTIAGVSFDGSANISLNNNAITNGAGYLTDLVNDSSPQLGGNLDVQSSGFTTSTSNGNIKATPNGSGVFEVRSSGSVDGTLQLNCNVNSHGVKLRSPSHSAGQSYTLVLPDNQVAADKFLKVKSISGSGSTATGQLEYASLDIVNDTSPDLGGDLQSNGNDIDFADTDKAIFGNDGDLEIFHDGANSYVQAISNGSGDLYVVANTKSIYLRPKTNENGIKIVPDGAVTLYHDNTARLLTGSSGVSITGNCNVDGNIILSDNEEIHLGNSTDFRIYHSGSHSFVQDVGQGSLKLAGADVQIVNSDNTAVMAQFISGGKNELRFDGNTKFETTSSGIDITGNATSSVSSLSDGSTITVNFASASHFTVTLGGNRTFGDPGSTSNAIGSSGSIFIVQDGTGSRTASFHSDYKFAGGTAPTLSTAANAVDRLDFVVRASDNVHCVVTLDVK
tara:strand:- start:1411 stop:2925 length:1515 start_codon:yes stop_codon:yes gene_type:complete